MSNPPKAPKPPDPVQTAQAQTQSNVQTAQANQVLGNTNQITPYGSVQYSYAPGPGGLQQATQTVTESPNQQTLRQLEENQGIALGNLGLEQTGRVSDLLSQPYDPRRIDLADALGGNFDIEGKLGNFGDDVRERSFNLATQGLGDMFDRSEESLRSRLANQGINAGTDAFGAEMESFNRGKGNAYADALLAADSNALAQRGQATGELTQQRGINLSEALQQYGIDTTADQAARTNPLNEIIALASGVQTSPINPGAPVQSQMAGTDVAGIYNQGFANQMAGYNTQMQGRNALLGSIAGLGGAALGSPWIGSMFKRAG